MHELSRSERLRIRGILLTKGLTGEVLASRLGVSQPTISQVIKGRTVSRKVREFIAKQIGYWPWKGDRANSAPENGSKSPPRQRAPESKMDTSA